MDSVKQQIVERLKQANNILVTVKNDPSIDLLSACIGLSLLLDKLDKHAAAVFSGAVPSAMEFLKPEETIEATPNSLRDFIIALDKSKADKLRYKVEDKLVRIFITPYKTSITQDDLEFTQGDFNIDVVVALGAHEQGELDEAITAHGRILHDATVIAINNTPNSNLGSLNWQEISASSVSEMIADLATSLGDNLLDEQIATALLTGVVAETVRFSNDKTSPQTMRIAGELMAAGANQQLVANELKDTAAVLPKPLSSTLTGELTTATGDSDALQIDHPTPAPIIPSDNSQQSAEKPAEEQISIAPERTILPLSNQQSSDETSHLPQKDALFTGSYGDDRPSGERNSYLVDAPAASPVTSQASDSSKLELPNPFAQPVAPVISSTPKPSVPPIILPPVVVPQVPSITQGSITSDAPGQTLEDLERSVGSAHLFNTSAQPVDNVQTTPFEGNLADARMQVLAALNQGLQPIERPEALGSNALVDYPLHNNIPMPGEIPLHDDGPTALDEQTKPMAIEVDDQGNLKSATLSGMSTRQVNDMLPPSATPYMANSGEAQPPTNAPPPIAPPFTPGQI
jgi:nanoRNase/pAp phosphatase (c-di-AMP/oligoRNAs hydrolase)